VNIVWQERAGRLVLAICLFKAVGLMAGKTKNPGKRGFRGKGEPVSEDVGVEVTGQRAC
jgi:hypothetical protein